MMKYSPDACLFSWRPCLANYTRNASYRIRSSGDSSLTCTMTIEDRSAPIDGPE
jgi:hypothetical protein